MPRFDRAVARAECMNAHWVLTLAGTREKLDTSRRYDNEARPQGADLVASTR
jgi:hypothetical protein